MRKKILSLLLCVFMFGIMCGCGAEQSTSTKVELRDDPVKSSSDYASGSGNAMSQGTKDNDSDSSGKIKIGFVQTANESGWRAAHTQSMKDIFSQDRYSYKFIDGQGEQSVQIAGIEELINDGYDAIILAPMDCTAVTEALTACEEAGIPVILSDRQMQLSDDSLYEAWVGGNFVKEGETCGDWLADYLEKQGRADEEINMVTIQGTIGASAQVGRTEGMENKLKEHSNWNMLDKQSGEFTQAKGQEVMESFLKSYDDIDVVICENDNEAFGAIDAIKAAGKTCGPEGDIIVVSFDSVKAAFESMIAGDLNATFECNPLHGPRVAEIIQKLEKGEEVEKIQYVDEAYFDTSMDLEEILKTRAY